MKVILPGSYDPVTLGHLDLIRRASESYEEVFAVIFVGFLIYRLVMQSRSLEVDGTVLKVSRFFGLIKEGEVDLKKFDGYYLDYVRTGRDGKDVYGYFCLLKKDTTVTRLCFNDYDDFDEFLKDAVEPVIPRVTYRKR